MHVCARGRRWEVGEGSVCVLIGGLIGCKIPCTTVCFVVCVCVHAHVHSHVCLCVCERERVCVCVCVRVFAFKHPCFYIQVCAVFCRKI